MSDSNLTTDDRAALRSRARGSLREAIARILHDANTGRITPDSSDPTKYGAMADALIDQGIGPMGEGYLIPMIDEWLDGEPFEISQARLRRPIDFVAPEDQPGYFAGYAAAVAHVAGIQEESRRRAIEELS